MQLKSKSKLEDRMAKRVKFKKQQLPRTLHEYLDNDGKIRCKKEDLSYVRSELQGLSHTKQNSWE